MTNFFSINAYSPVTTTGEIYNERLNVSAESYTISTTKGFDSATFSLSGEQPYLVDWFQNGLGRRVTWIGPDGGLGWEGYVNRMQYSFGGVSLTRTLDGVANKIRYNYGQLNTGVNPPTVSDTTLTAEDTFSQSLYGIKERSINGEDSSSAGATSKVEALLFELGYPLTGESQYTLRGLSPSLKVEMRGYANMLDWMLYNQTSVSGTDNADVIVKAILTAEAALNAAISTDVSLIDSNATATEKYWEYSPGWGVITEMAQRGEQLGGAGRPWVAMILDDRKVIFKATEGIIYTGEGLSTNQHGILTRQITDAGATYRDEGENEIPYWQIRPDRILRTEGIPGDTRYIKRVSFAPPNNLQLQSSDDVNRLTALLSVAGLENL